MNLEQAIFAVFGVPLFVLFMVIFVDFILRTFKN